MCAKPLFKTNKKLLFPAGPLQNENKEIWMGVHVVWRNIYEYLIDDENTQNIKPYGNTVLCKCSHHIDGLVQEICNSIANALELRLFCTNPSISYHM